MNYRLLLFVHTFAICHSIIGAELPAKRALTESAAKEAYFKAKEQLYQSCNSVLQAIKDEERYEYDNISKQEKTERMPLQINGSNINHILDGIDRPLILLLNFHSHYYSKDPALLDYLLKLEADVNSAGLCHWNKTALEVIGQNVFYHQTSIHENNNCLQKILERGADPNRVHPISHTTCIHDFVDGFQYLRNDTIQESWFTNPFPLLKKYKANFNTQDQNGNTPLHKALQNDDFMIAHALLNEGANPLILNNDQTTPAMMAHFPEYDKKYEESFFVIFLHGILKPEYYESINEKPVLKDQLWCQVIIKAYLDFIKNKPALFKEILNSTDTRIQNKLKLMFKDEDFPTFKTWVNQRIENIEEEQRPKYHHYNDFPDGWSHRRQF